MKMLIRLIFAVLPFLVCPYAIAQQTIVEQDAATRLQSYLKKASTLQAEFTQVKIDEQGRPGNQSEGLFYLQRPGHFRWEYLRPQHQQIISGDNKVWFYDVDLEQVTIKQLNRAIGATPALLLSGDVPLLQNFTIDTQLSEDNLNWIRLVPKDEESGFKYVMIAMDRGALAGMELSDNFGQLTRIYFKNLEAGKPLPSALFQFTPPKGVDVLEDR